MNILFQADNYFLLLLHYLALSEHLIHIYIVWPCQCMCLRCQKNSHIRRLNMTPCAQVVITTILICTYIAIFYRMDTAYFCPYAVTFIITMNDYVCVWLVTYQFFILCLCIVLYHLHLVHISNTLLGWGRSHLWSIYVFSPNDKFTKLYK